MSDIMRWRYGDTNPVMAAVDSATVIEIGDLVYQNVDDCRPAKDQPFWSTNDGRRSFASRFLGVAMQRSREGDTDAIRVATTGVFEFDCTSNTFELGQIVGPERTLTDETSCGLLNQQVTIVPDSRYAIGRIAKRATSSATSVLVQICSTIMNGGVHGTTA